MEEILVFSIAFLMLTSYSSIISSGKIINDKIQFTSIKMNLPVNNSKIVRIFNNEISVMITFKLRNESVLQNYLSQIDNPKSEMYHKYIDRKEFSELFGSSPKFYYSAVNYFSQFKGIDVETFSDHVSIVLSGKASLIGNVFNAKFGLFSKDGRSFYSIAQEPSLPVWIANNVSYISGLDNFTSFSINLHKEKIIDDGNKITLDNGYPNPLSYGDSQYIFGSDLQVAYDEQTLFNFTYPVNEVIATILWSGQYMGENITTPYGELINGTLVGPFNPNDIYAYFNDTIPYWEPRSRVIPVPLNGAPEPSPLSSYDITGAVDENTLDIEMAGSLAPGAIIFNVYGPNSTQENLDQALAFILNPNSSYKELNNVTVISNSWGSPEYNDTSWYEYLQEAQARGITVLASSGDSGNNQNSSKYMQPNYPGDWLEFPASMAYNNFGVTAVGGTTLNLNSNLHIENQIAWYISQNDTANGGPAGSTGGISYIFKEPLWQLNSLSNKVIKGLGRAVPDIAAIANNTIAYITVNNTNYYDNPFFYVFWGTSISSPVEAGIIAEMNAVLKIHNREPLGYLNSAIYLIGYDQLKPLVNTSETGYILTNSYNSSLPTLPFCNVNYGRNHVYQANYGYNLVTGWGSIDAYNLTMYILNVNYNGTYGALDGVENILNLTSLNVTSYYLNGTVNTYFNASVQQNFFLANSMGAPVYWIQNVIYINGSAESGWNMTYSGWVVYPFYGLYPNLTVYEYNYPLGKIVKLPHLFDIKSWISNFTFMRQTMNFEVNSHLFQLPVPGASYIIGSYNYSYLWQGKRYTNGPYPNYANPGGLSPQFCLVGGPSGGIGYFKDPTSATMKSYVLPLGSDNYIRAFTSLFNYTNDQTGEAAENLNWVLENGYWQMYILNGSQIQGVISVEPKKTFYNVTFEEQGLPSGTLWNVTFNGITEISRSNEITFQEYNGTYFFSISSVNGYNSNPNSGKIKVNGNDVIQIIFKPKSLNKFSVTFEEYGLPLGITWSVTLGGITKYSSSNEIIYYGIENGSYSFTIGNVNGYNSNPNSGIISVNGYNITQLISFSKILYNITFNETGLKYGIAWTVILNGTSKTAISGNITFYLPNGTYKFEIISGNNDYAPNPSIVTVTVDGKNMTLKILFSLIEYEILFNESGLPAGIAWYVNLSNGQSFSSSINRIIFNEPNGSYYFMVASIDKNYRPVFSSGSFIVNGSPVNELITFNLLTYKITFNESGLPYGQIWNVTLNGITKSSPNNTIIFYEPNGSYDYSVSGIPNYRAVNASGIVNVDGNPINLNINWSVIFYKITIIVNGISNGTLWSATLHGITFNGKSINITLSSETNKIVFYEPNGSYFYNVKLPNNYIISGINGPIVVSGNQVVKNFNAQWGNDILITIILVIAAIAIIGIILIIKTRKK